MIKPKRDGSLWVGSIMFIILFTVSYYAANTAIEGLNEDLIRLGLPPEKSLGQEIKEQGGLIGYSKYTLKGILEAFNGKGRPIRQVGQLRDY